MKQSTLLIVIVVLLTACTATRRLSGGPGTDLPGGDTLITQSLFTDRSSTISEENIQKILEGTYSLPQQLRVAIVRLEPATQSKTKSV